MCLESNHAGWWIDFGAEPLVECLKTAMATPRHELDAMDARGRAWVQVDFWWLEVTQKMIKPYKWILHGGSAPTWIREN